MLSSISHQCTKPSEYNFPICDILIVMSTFQSRRLMQALHFAKNLVSACLWSWYIIFTLLYTYFDHISFTFTYHSSISSTSEPGIRHPEELSLCKPLAPEHLKQNYQDTMLRKRAAPPTKDGNTGERIDTNTFITNTSLVSGMTLNRFNDKTYPSSCMMCVIRCILVCDADNEATSTKLILAYIV